MQRHAICFAFLLALSAGTSAADFTYRGQLQDEGVAASGRFDLQFSLYADRDGQRLLHGPIDAIDVLVRDGQFAVALDLPDFAASGWLEVAVRPADEVAYWPLGGREQVALKGGACPAAWELGGNAGTLATTNFLGTTDNQALEFRTANTRSLRIEPAAVLFEGAPITSNMVGGSRANEVASGVRGATIAGGGVPTGESDPLYGGENPNRVTAHYGFVGGGYDNRAGSVAVITEGQFSTVGGGQRNHASGSASAILGGFNNRADGILSSISGGDNHVASGMSAAIGGGSFNCAGGSYSFAAGRRAKVLPAVDPGGGGSCSGLSGYTGLPHDGTFVWADNQNTSFVSSGADQFNIRARGGVGINRAPLDAAVELMIAADADNSDVANLWLKERDSDNGILMSAGNASTTINNNAEFFIDHYNGITLNRRLELRNTGEVIIRSNITGTNTGVSMAANAGSWSSLSDRRLKTAISAIDPIAVLDRLVAIPISEWSYIAQGEAVRHIGPMAQDFAAAFAVGENDTTISTVDADGIALAAIQGLNAKLERENATLQSRLERLEARLQQLLDQPVADQP